MFAIAPLNTASLNATYERVFSIPFNSKSKYMLVIVKSVSGFELFVKGAPDVLEKFCMTESTGNTVPVNHARITDLQEVWSKQGQRVIMTCHKKLTIKEIPECGNEEMEAFIKEQLCGLSCVSLIGILDPPRKDVPNAVAVMRRYASYSHQLDSRAGIRIFMVTGDFKLTAESIARKVGIVTALLVDSLESMRQRKDLYEQAAKMTVTEMKPIDDVSFNGLVMDGKDVLLLEKQDWDVVFSYYPEIVFARTTPDQKMIIVQEAKKRGDNVVGVTGDGG
jgi:sodium/potassium-transporting ATPase subunit alpha